MALSSFLNVLTLLAICDCQWIAPKGSSSRLPIPQNSMSIGSYDSSIYILGGNQEDRNLVEYDTLSDTLTNHGSILPAASFGISSYYTQIQNILYIINANGGKLLAYNLQTNTMNTNYKSIPSGVGDSGCLASDIDHLFVVGGYNMYTVQVLDITHNQWLDNIPSIQRRRQAHSCIVDPITNILFAIGGFQGDVMESHTYTSSIEVIDTNNIALNTWSYFTPLTLPLGWVRSVYFDKMIYVIGGAYGSDIYSLTYVDKVHIIDATKGTITVSPDRLIYPVSTTASIVVNNVIYVFGGYDGHPDMISLDTWMYYHIITSNPTSSTSSTPHPTQLPSNMPTTGVPSSNPTSNPTLSSVSVTSSTSHPTQFPSNTPRYPSIMPSNIPTIHSMATVATTYRTTPVAVTSETTTSTVNSQINTDDTVYSDTVESTASVDTDTNLVDNNQTAMILIVIFGAAILIVIGGVLIYYSHLRCEITRYVWSVSHMKQQRKGDLNNNDINQDRDILEIEGEGVRKGTVSIQRGEGVETNTNGQHVLETDTGAYTTNGGTLSTDAGIDLGPDEFIVKSDEDIWLEMVNRQRNLWK